MTRRQIIYVHLAFWAVMLTLTGLETIPQFGIRTYSFIVLDYIFYAASFISMFYLFYYLISEKHLIKKKMVFFVVSGLLLIIVSAVPITLIYVYILFPGLFDLPSNKLLPDFGKYYFSFMETNFIFVTSGVLLKTALLWYNNFMKQKEIEKQILSNELSLLKSQINPRFLFDSLESIKSLAFSEPEKAVTGIEYLSEIMSFMLYETSSDKILLDDEIKSIKNYLEFKKILNASDRINFSVSGNTAGRKILPLIFLPLVEYIFSFNDGRSEFTKMETGISADETKLTCCSEITFPENINLSTECNEDILKSAERRLELAYGNRYKLEKKCTGEKYSIVLELGI
ncbi:MAG: histidine kinase [Ignavibacteriae bacterium]|nr:histidine kinase [Ignavibacteriota bacterium]